MINYGLGYVFEVTSFILIDCVIETLRIIKGLGCLCVLVTNQAGIAWGLYSKKNILHLYSHMLEISRRNDIEIEGVYYCPYHPDYNDYCECRSLNRGIPITAAQELNMSLLDTYLLVDKASYIKAGISASIRNSYK